MATKRSTPPASAAAASIVGAIERSMGVIEFKPDGTIVRANDLFLAVVGYALEDIQGRHHRIFVKPEVATQQAYQDFWANLASGQVVGGQFERVTKNGNSVWLEATYNPLQDERGKLVGVVKFATDVTEQVRSNQKSAAVIKAIDQSQAMIEFNPQGHVLQANPVFLQVMGYTAEELAGKHHALFTEPEYAASDAYRHFWSDLRSGKAFSGEFKRLGKGGKEVWLQASYSPTFGSDGKVTGVVKVASDITEAKQLNMANAGKIAAIERSMGVIEFELDGTIVHANAPFLAVVGYSQDEVEGQHHRLFVKPEEAESAAYAAFWESLSAGNVVPGQFERVTKDGRTVWLEATYNPILDLNGRTVRVVKFATDITDKFEAAQQVAENARELEAALEQAREAEQMREELDRTLQEMSTPVTPIWDEILLLPLVGVVDSTRTDDVMRKTLTRINETQSKVFILDISGVPAVDTAVANQLIKITKATRLMGCETIISGLSPSIAHTMVDLGVDVGDVRTTATLRDAFRISLRQVGALARMGLEHTGDARSSERHGGWASQPSLS
ncbi:MAG: PAS domain S-box protein [Betaproteobacteria bacterium]